MMITIYTDGGERTVPHDIGPLPASIPSRWNRSAAALTSCCLVSAASVLSLFILRPPSGGTPGRTATSLLSYEFLGLCRILVGPDQQRAPTSSPAAGRHCGAQVLVRIEAGNYRLQVRSPHRQ